MLAMCIISCSNITPISNLALPPVTVIKGNVYELESNSLVLKDESDKISVAYPNETTVKPVLFLNDTITVYGNLRPGTPGVFDAYVIKTESQTYIMQQPGGHIGIILQTGFK